MNHPFRLFKAVVAALYPERCIFCRDVVPTGASYCSRCAKTIPFIPTEKRWIKPGPFESALEGNAALFRYAGGVRQAVGDFKFKGNRDTGRKLADLLCQGLAEVWPLPPPFDLVTCVPMTRQKERERGYNQADLLARAVADHFGVDYAPELLQRQTPFTQHQLSAGMRRQSVEVSFFIGEGARAQGQRILIVDDIFTTGSTLKYCAHLLREAGAQRVLSATLARRDT